LKDLDINFLYQFASSVSGKQHSTSDVDLAFYSRNEYENYAIFVLVQDLSSKLGKEVDLIQFKIRNN